MRKIVAAISAVLLVLLITAGILEWRGADLFNKTPRSLPQLPKISQEVADDGIKLSYEERLQKGDDYFSRGFLTFAASEYAKATSLEPKKIEPYQKLLQTHYALGNYQKALSNAEVALKINPTDLDTHYEMIRIQIRLSNFDVAKSLLESYPQTETPSARILYYKGLISALFNDHDNAGKHLKLSLNTSQDNSLDSHIETVLGAYEEFNVAKAAEPLYRSELLARSFNKVGEYEMAIHILKDVLKARSDLRDGWILLGFAYLNLEKYQFALTAFERAYRLDSEWPTTQYFLGIAHKGLGNVDKSIQFFNLALTNDFEPKVVIYKDLADLYFETKNYQKSAEAYEKVLVVNKKDIGSFVRPVWLYLDFVKDPVRALNLAQSAALAFPESAMSYNLLGWSYTGLKDYKKAEDNLKRALAMDPTFAAAHYNIGNLYLEKEEEKTALESFQKAYDLDRNGSIGNLAAKAYNELLQSTN